MTQRRRPTAAITDGAWTPSRRELLRTLALGSVVGAVGCSSEDQPSTEAGSTKRSTTSGRTGRTRRALVVLELAGGNDGWSTLVPHGFGRYHDLRPTLAVADEDVIDWGSGWGLNRRLATFDRHGVAAVTGVGVTQPDLSHFEMLDRWWAGAEDGHPADRPSGYPSGFLGRLCDAVKGDEELTGVSLRFGSSLALRSATAGTAGLGAIADAAGASSEGATRQLLRDFSGASGTTALQAAGRGMGQVVWIMDLLDRLAKPSGTYPETAFGHQMALASRLLRTDQAPRVIHVPMGDANFDTHAKHAETHPVLLEQLDAGVAAFVDDLAANDLTDHVLIATTSEFGRRPDEHDGGLDHGTASTMLLLGPVVRGIHGEPSSLDTFDDRDNLIATVGFSHYYATLAAWLGVPGDAAGPPFGGTTPAPIDGVLRT